MNKVSDHESPQSNDLERKKAELESALEEEVRISRRQILLKKLWKLNQIDSEHELRTM